jgi:CspA family cold shock protein
MRESGVVRAFDPLKGFGFIRREKGKDVFFFYSEINEEDRLLFVGDIVSFVVEIKPKGPRALDVRREGSLFV